MPKIYRVHLTDDQREELRRRKRDPRTKPRTRDRLEMIRLSDSGKAIPEIAAVVEQSEQRVRYWIKRFLDRQTFDALDDRPHHGQASAITPEIMEALRAEIEKGERTWTARQLADWVTEQFGVTVTPEHLGTRLNRAKLLWKRTSRSLKHKQKPEEVAERKADLETLEKGGRGLDRCLSSRRSGVRDDPTDDLQWVSSGKASVGGL